MSRSSRTRRHPPPPREQQEVSVSNERRHGTSVRGNVSGTGIAIGAGASANVSQISTSGDPTFAAALELLRRQLASLDVRDDETADRVALAETRLDRLEEAIAADGERDHGRMRKLF